MSGKGDKRRKGANDAKYAEGWDRIFGQSNSSKTKRNTNTTGTKDSAGTKRSSS